MKSRKATHGQLRRENRQLILRTVHARIANSRADLSQETGLAKPTVSDLISELMQEGYLVETGLGQSTDEGGKRPRLLEFVPDARHVIGVSLSAEKALGVLANLNGEVLFEHYRELEGAQGNGVFDVLTDVINGLLAQIDAPLLCLGVGVPGVVDTPSGVVRLAPHLGWQDFPLAGRLAERYHVASYVANSTELAAMAEFAFGETNGADNLVTVLVDDSVGVGLVLDSAAYHNGGEIGQLHSFPMSGAGVARDHDGSSRPLELSLGWLNVKGRAEPLAAKYGPPPELVAQPADALTYLTIRRAIADEDPLALDLQEELAEHLAQIFSWVIGLLRPNHISLAGDIADLGEDFLEYAVEKTQSLILPDLMRSVTFTLDNSANLVAIGAVAHTLQRELGLV